MSVAAAVIILVAVALAMGTMCFVVVVLTRNLQQLSRLLMSKSPIEAARAERILNGEVRPPGEATFSPAEMP